MCVYGTAAGFALDTVMHVKCKYKSSCVICLLLAALKRSDGTVKITHNITCSALELNAN